METKEYFPDYLRKDLVGFRTSCVSLNTDWANIYMTEQERYRHDCNGWKPSGRSLIAQEPYTFRGDASYEEYVMFDLTYESMFF